MSFTKDDFNMIMNYIEHKEFEAYVNDTNAGIPHLDMKWRILGLEVQNDYEDGLFKDVE